jgi:hypothetical protein
MRQRTIRPIVTLLALVFVSATITLAQSTTTLEIPVAPDRNTWRGAPSFGSSKGKLFVVTIDQPHRRQTCRVKSLTQDELVCSRVIGRPRTYHRQQVVALLLPGDNELRLRVLLGLNGGAAAAVWGTVALAAACPACAVATGIAALVLVSFAGAVGFTDDQRDRILYLAPGQQLSRKLGFIQE